jgi:hypothetical protein
MWEEDPTPEHARAIYMYFQFAVSLFPAWFNFLCSSKHYVLVHKNSHLSYMRYFTTLFSQSHHLRFSLPEDWGPFLSQLNTHHIIKTCFFRFSVLFFHLHLDHAVPWLRQLVAGLSELRPGFVYEWDLWWPKWHWDRLVLQFSPAYHSTMVPCTHTSPTGAIVATFQRRGLTLSTWTTAPRSPKWSLSFKTSDKLFFALSPIDKIKSHFYPKSARPESISWH